MIFQSMMCVPGHWKTFRLLGTFLAHVLKALHFTMGWMLRFSRLQLDCKMQMGSVISIKQEIFQRKVLASGRPSSRQTSAVNHIFLMVPLCKTGAGTWDIPAGSSARMGVTVPVDVDFTKRRASWKGVFLRRVAQCGFWSVNLQTRKRRPLVCWFPGPLVLWSICPGPLVLWSFGPLVPWSSGPLVLWSLGPLVPWCSGPWVFDLHFRGKTRSR